jgi:hypothetical protein
MAKSDTLSEKFNSSAIWETAKFAFNAIVIGFLIGGLVDFTFFHNHPAGKALIQAVNEPLQKFYDFALNAFGFSEYTRALPGATAVAGAAADGCMNSLGDMIPCPV